jgi:cobalt/nickel transport protein
VSGAKFSTGLVVAVALALAVGLGTAASPFASSAPDGLERVAEEKGLIDRGELAPIQEAAPVPDYSFPGIENKRLATGIAGFVGTLAVFAIGAGLAWALRRRGPDHDRGDPAPSAGTAT